MEIGTLERIQSVRGSLKPTIRAIADKVLENPSAARSMNLKELASACAVSEASISRFVRDVGIDSFRTFQLRLAEECAAESAGTGGADEGLIYESIGRDDNATTVMTKVALRTSDIARACLSTVDVTALDRAAQLIRESRAIYVFAAGLSALAAENAVMRFSRIGRPVVASLDHNTQLLTASALRPDAVALAISDSGRTAHTLTALRAARAAGAATIAVTGFADAPLARVADVVVRTPTGYAPRNKEPLYESMVSKFGQLIVIDALYSLVAVQDYDNSVELVRRGDQHIQQSRSPRRSNDAG
jgi:RpiR family transcriptional regulator, carbohydrate utilization regulator